jgi:hypothetical protein
MEKQVKELRKQYGLTSTNLSKEEVSVLHQKDVFGKNLDAIPRTEKFESTPGFKWMADKVNAERADKATSQGRVIIDKECILSYPLNDPRTSPTLRNAYLDQQDLMSALAQIEWDEKKEDYGSTIRTKTEITKAEDFGGGTEISDVIIREERVSYQKNPNIGILPDGTLSDVRLSTPEADHIKAIMSLTPEQIKQCRDAEKTFIEKVYSRGDIFG